MAAAAGILLTLATFFLFGMAVYMGLYSLGLHENRTPGREFIFKGLFWVAFSSHAILSVAGTYFAAHRLQIPAERAVLVASAVTVGVLAWPTLLLLSLLNECSVDLAFPIDWVTCGGG